MFTAVPASNYNVVVHIALCHFAHLVVDTFGMDAGPDLKLLCNKSPQQKSNLTSALGSQPLVHI